MNYLIGLGNPGAEYEHTRHNIGRDLVLAYQEARGFSSWTNNSPAKAIFSSGNVKGESVELVLPETFMNRSGETARFLVEKNNAKPEDLIVIYDDIDLPLGQFKISKDRGHGGHNGIKSIESSINSQSFVRVRVGIAETSFWTGRVKRPSGGERMSKYVLGRFSSREDAMLKQVQPEIFAAIDVLVSDGPELAMNKFN